MSGYNFPALAKQAQQDARDALDGHRIYPCYPHGTTPAKVYAAAFVRAIHELQADPETEAIA